MLAWIILGALMASALWVIYIKIHSVRKMSAAAWILAVVSVLWAGFTLAWTFSSILEGEIRAAGMGLLVFGIIFIIFAVLTRVLIIGKKTMNTSKTGIDA
ncbi:MAG TPA: dehalogenase [Peptococcaceae bacterium]|nr:dehalogenase [Peptococcaceae bacterium]